MRVRAANGRPDGSPRAPQKALRGPTGSPREPNWWVKGLKWWAKGPKWSAKAPKKVAKGSHKTAKMEPKATYERKCEHIKNIEKPKENQCFLRILGVWASPERPQRPSKIKVWRLRGPKSGRSRAQALKKIEKKSKIAKVAPPGALKVSATFEEKSRPTARGRSPTPPRTR